MQGDQRNVERGEQGEDDPAAAEEVRARGVHPLKFRKRVLGTNRGCNEEADYGHLNVNGR